MIYSETHVDVFDCTTGDWLQTLNVKRARPLNNSGSLTTCMINDMPYVIHLSNLHQSKYLLLYIHIYFFIGRELIFFFLILFL